MDQQLNTIGMALLAVGGYMVVTWLRNMAKLKEEGTWQEAKWQSIFTLILWLGLIVLGYSLM